MYCDYCDEEIQDGEIYIYLDTLDVILHDEYKCRSGYIDDIAIHKVRNIDDEKASESEEN